MNLKYEIIFKLKKIYWFLARPKRQGVKCILESRGKVLMLKRSFGTDKYVFPGGAVHNGETAEEAVQREIREDLGLELVYVKSLGSFEQTVHHRQETLHCFSAIADPTKINLDKDKIQSVEWFDLKNLPELTPVSKSVISQFSK